MQMTATPKRDEAVFKAGRLPWVLKTESLVHPVRHGYSGASTSVRHSAVSASQYETYGMGTPFPRTIGPSSDRHVKK